MRRAFVMGSNGPAKHSPLRFANADTEAIKTALSGPRCGFEVTTPEPGANVWEVFQKLYEIAQSCRAEDTFICYFAGHGILDKGALYLLWDNTQLEELLTTSIPASNIMQAFKYCKSRSKLLILDCCHAGAIVNMSGFRNAAGIPVEEMDVNPENHLVLMASDRFNNARELEELKGGFLTHNVCAALREGFDQADIDGDKRLSIQDLRLWLEKKAKEHNRRFPEKKVPYPHLFGKQKGNFYFTLGRAEWVPYEIPLIDGTTLVVLPVRRDLYTALCIGKHPITNFQYKKFVESVGLHEPMGEHFINDQWQGPFYPWQEDQFRDPGKPVVCISLPDAKLYCEWVTATVEFEVRLPTPREWDFSAFGTEFPSRNPDVWLSQTQELHHKSLALAPVENTGIRTNIRGISDMLGNVWEWCGSTSPKHRSGMQKIARPDFYGRDENSELRGGSFLDDLTIIEPFIEVSKLQDGKDTRHSDLGFRLAASVPIKRLPDEIQLRLSEFSQFRARTVHAHAHIDQPRLTVRRPDDDD